ncbi:TlpA disulfide reductase family protein [Flavobacterium sp.]|uniref:TlpA family protein disulfide reductase n=1 Tax=Flavobacterium sp. TaxID=239 RepID=UPI00286E1182|nr:TlpA disulfide reductase family protein [Flavobacterium sp.]
MKKLFLIALTTFCSTYSFGQSKNTISFQAEIVNRNGDVIYIKDTKNKTIKEIKINDKGVFKDTFKIEKDDFYMFFDGTEYTQLFLKNGFDLKLKMDAKQFDESIIYDGKGAAENNYLAQDAIKNEQINPEKLVALSEDEFKKMTEEKKLTEETTLDKSGFDKTFIEIQKRNISMNIKGLKQYYNESKAAQKLNNTIAPTFNYVNHKGGTTKPEDLKGKYVYIDIWATWCGPCLKEIPFLQKIEEKYHRKNIEFVSISVDVKKDFEKWKKFVADKQLGGIQLFADNDWNSDFTKSLSINSIPRFILIDPSGKIVNADAEKPSSPKLQEVFDKLLN